MKVIGYDTSTYCFELEFSMDEIELLRVMVEENKYQDYILSQFYKKHTEEFEKQDSKGKVIGNVYRMQLDDEVISRLSMMASSQTHDTNPKILRNRIEEIASIRDSLWALIKNLVDAPDI